MGGSAQLRLSWMFCRRNTVRSRSPEIRLYKILFYFKALLWESIILLLPLPPAKPTLLQYYCTTIAQYTTPPVTSRVYAIYHAILGMAISCKGQPGNVRNILHKSYVSLVPEFGFARHTETSFVLKVLCTPK